MAAAVNNDLGCEFLVRFHMTAATAVTASAGTDRVGPRQGTLGFTMVNFPVFAEETVMN